MSESKVTSTDGLVAELEAAHADYEETREQVAERGEHELEVLADAYDRATTLLDKYEDRATGTGDFEGFIEFQEAFDEFVEGLDEDLTHRKAFEDANEDFDKRRLSSSDFAAARNALSPVADLTELLDERATKRENYRETHRRVLSRRDELDERIEELARLRRLGDADLDAPIEDLRTPIETYNERVRDAFASFKHDASVREVLRFVEKTEQYPLVSFRPPPPDLKQYIETNEAGTEPLPQLLEYADYSPSKLSHYVENPDALKRNVAVHRSYLDGLDAQPLVVSWPPPPADELRYLAQELVSIVARFAPNETVATLHEIRAFARNERYERLRRSAKAHAGITAAERKRLAEGGVEDDLERTRNERERLTETLSNHPEP